jgi:L-asparaginase/Glu-tRNA(Gln) amidotransferase subunit D
VTIDAMMPQFPESPIWPHQAQISNVGSQDMSFDILLTLAKRINELARSRCHGPDHDGTGHSRTLQPSI